MKKKILHILFVLVLVLSFSLMTAVPAVANGGGAPLTGYEIITKTWVFGDGGYAGWSAPAGKVVLGGGYYATGPVSVSAPGTPGSVWPHHTFGANEYGWVVRDAPDGVGNTITLYAIFADEPAGYGIVTSGFILNYGDGGWAGWSAPAGSVVLGGGYALTGKGAAVSAPATPGSVWPHYTFPADEYGWVVRDAPDGAASPGSAVYTIYADEPAGYGIVTSGPTLNYGDGGWAGWSVPSGKVLSGGHYLTGGGAAVSAPGTPGSVWPHWTFGANEYGWCVRDLPDGNSSPGSTVYAVYANATNVDIDIKPGTYPNDINLGAKGVVPVAILGSADFDASTIDPQTVELAGAPAREKGNSGKFGSLKDVNGDGYDDLVVHVDIAGLALVPGDTFAVLTGNLYDTTPILGVDSVQIVP